MITKNILRAQLAEKCECDEKELYGEKIKDILSSLPENISIFWRNIPEPFLNELFEE